MLFQPLQLHIFTFSHVRLANENVNLTFKTVLTPLTTNSTAYKHLTSSVFAILKRQQHVFDAQSLVRSYKCRSTVTSVDRQLYVSIDSCMCRSTVICVDRQL